MGTIIMRHCRRCGTVRLHKPLMVNGQTVGIYCTMCGALVEQATFESKPDKRQQGGR